MKKFISGRDGSILLEAAIAIPVLVAMLLGMAEFGEAFTIRRKNAQVASTAADLVAQVASVTTANLNDIANIASMILQPYPWTSSDGLQIMSITQNANNATVNWSYGFGNATAPGKGSTYPLPAGLISQNQTIIVATSSYAFTPDVGSYLTGGTTFTSTAYYVPRLGNSVSCC